MSDLVERLFNYNRATAAYDMIEAAKRIEALEAALERSINRGSDAVERIATLEAALRGIAAIDPRNIRADDLGRAARIASAALAPEQSK